MSNAINTTHVAARPTRTDAPADLLAAADRFTAKIEVGPIPPAVLALDSPCAVWTGARNRSGYGVVKIRAYRPSNLLAHLVSFQLYVGDVPAGCQVHHRCHVRACVNPEHLEAKETAAHVAEHNQTRHTRKTRLSLKSGRGHNAKPRQTLRAGLGLPERWPV
jgi:HNH endonuclease